MRQPNLLFIYTDEQAFDTLAAYGNHRIRMPNLNRFAERCTVLDEVYVTQPVCTASRSSLLTGLYPHATGCVANCKPLRPEMPCLPEMITEGGYATGHFGKWHLGDELTPQHGFDEWVSIEDVYTTGDARSDYHRFLIDAGYEPGERGIFLRDEAARLPEEHGKPAFLAGEASRFIRGHRDRPFVLYVNFLEPHMPYFGPRDDQHDRDTIPLPANFDALPGPGQPIKTRLLQDAYAHAGHSGLPLKTEADWRRLIANYWGLCSLVDTHVGTILDTLGECGLDDETVVVFTSDHGDMMGSHRLTAKCVMYQEAVRVPLLLRLPGQREARRVTGPVNQIDLVPTILDLMGQRLPDHLQGESLASAVEAGGPAGRDAVFIQWNGSDSGLDAIPQGDARPDWLAEIATDDQIASSVADRVRTIVRADGWKLNCSPLGEHELYQLENDPGETRNLHGTDEHRPIARELAEQIRSWQDRHGDTVVMPEP